ncbi:PRMT5 arginine-N-methyltransferase-domain-containing protein [Blastocladiella britannica]|nr:PRMT5 arginine-N-methyltransferase-domain-containing protein [Blastocladiella britannica]
MSKPPAIGLQLGSGASTHDALVAQMTAQQYTFVAAPILVGPQPDTLAAVPVEQLTTPLEFDELFIQSPDYANITVATCKHYFDAEHVASAKLRQKANLHLHRLFNWAGHISVCSLMLDLPASHSAIPEFARALDGVLSMIPYSSIWLRVALTDSAWSRWNLLRCLMGHNTKVHVALEVGPTLPDQPPASAGFPAPFPLQGGTGWARWHAEPIAALVMSTDTFLTNKKACPVLSKRHQALVREFLPREPYFLVQSPAGNGEFTLHAQYLAYLHRSQPSPSVRDRFAAGYTDYLQSPLQPLMDHLEAQTYEVFERDPVKYQKYQEAVAACLSDRAVAAGHAVAQLVMVVGAGPRGPLVDCVLRAAGETSVPVHVIAVEKNPNAIVSLRRKVRDEWGSESVTVVFADMREWKPKQKCDILVSELLGSFGDNELSPECLDGVQHVLKANGVSIPQSYTPRFAPLSSSKLFTEAAKSKTLAAMETNYVVQIRNAWISSQPKAAWTFSHPLPADELLHYNLHNERYSALTFEMTEPTLVHGMAGYFDCVLYKDVFMSTSPEKHTPEMTSWFPIYFPIRHPVMVASNSRLTFHIWRRTASHKVWYEWAVVPEPSPAAEDTSLAGFGAIIHNQGGRSHWIGL